MKQTKNAPDADEIQKMEALLQFAAAYEPEERAPEGLAYRALARCQKRPIWNRPVWRQMTAAAILAAASLLAFTLWVHHSRERMVNAHLEAFRQLPLSAQAGMVAPPMAAQIALPGTHSTMASTPSTGPETAAASVSTADNRVAVESSNPALPTRTAGDLPKERPVRRHYRPRTQHAAPAAPKVRWVTQTVRREYSGVLDRAWIPQRDAEHDRVIMVPVVMNIPVHAEETVHPVSHPRSELHITPVNYSEESP
jgi:hypothetical protein